MDKFHPARDASNMGRCFLNQQSLAEKLKKYPAFATTLKQSSTATQVRRFFIALLWGDRRLDERLNCCA